MLTRTSKEKTWCSCSLKHNSSLVPKCVCVCVVGEVAWNYFGHLVLRSKVLRVHLFVLLRRTHTLPATLQDTLLVASHLAWSHFLFEWACPTLIDSSVSQATGLTCEVLASVCINDPLALRCLCSLCMLKR